MEMESISGVDEFEEILKHSKEISQPILIDWLVNCSSIMFLPLLFNCFVYCLHCELFDCNIIRKIFVD